MGFLVSPEESVGAGGGTEQEHCLGDNPGSNLAPHRRRMDEEAGARQATQEFSQSNGTWGMGLNREQCGIIKVLQFQ